MNRSFYAASVREFMDTPTEVVLDRLVSASSFAGFSARDTQVGAWEAEIGFLKSWLAGLEGTLYLEFSIPRMGLRADAVLLIGPAILVFEFKVGSREFSQSARDQVWDYALDIKNFHEPSHGALVIPLLVATLSTGHPLGPLPTLNRDLVVEPMMVTPAEVRSVIASILQHARGEPINPTEWESGRYAPTPTIVEAALALYNRHSVSDISRSDAGATNLTITSTSIQRIIEETRERREKAICFVTGVPGSGKTLVGLNVATTNMDHTSELYSVYLSGNGPLVKVLSEALARDKRDRLRSEGKKASLPLCRSEVKTFIQNVHHFRDEGLRDKRPPAEHVAIFDEAQRAWTLAQTERFMERRKNVPSFGSSEPQFLIECMDRHSDWSVVVCLVGGGQEINTGEAGISEWFAALGRKFTHWRVYVSDRLGETDYLAGAELKTLGEQGKLEHRSELHLSTSLRSFRAESVSRLVQCILELDPTGATEALRQAKQYPTALTRDLDSAKNWLRIRSRGSERRGIMVSSSAQRLKPLALDVRSEIDPVHWFLDDRKDTRSSDFLEDAATEFQVQGLELDWGCIAWDADLRFTKSGWEHWRFTGDRWRKIHQPSRQRFLLNAYRVLLTRARQGMVVVVPRGDPNDNTRLPAFYDQTFDYLRGLGFEQIP